MRYYSIEKKENKILLKLAGANPRNEEDMSDGKYWSAKSQRELLDLINEDVNILHILKGEVFLSRNIFPLFTLCKRIKKKYPHVKICLWTRASIKSCLKECKNNPQIKSILELVDIVVEQYTKTPRAIDVPVLLKEHRIKQVKI